MIIPLILQMTLLPLPLPSSENAQLMLLVKQSQEQLQTLRRILNSSEATEESVEQAMRAMDRITMGIDNVLEPYKGSRQYQEAALNLQLEGRRERNPQVDVDRYQQHFPEEAAQSRLDQKQLERFLSNINQANEADLFDLSSFENRLLEAEAGEVSKLNALATAKSWEASLRLSTQLNELLSEIRVLREEVQSQEINRKIRSADMDEQLRQALKESFNIR